MMKKTLIVFAAALTCLLASTVSFAQEEVTPPEGLVFKKVRGSRTLTLTACPLVSGITKVYIADGKYVQLPAKMKRGSYELAKKYNYFACADEGEGNYVLYTKVKPNLKVFKYDPKLSDFPKNQLSRFCSNIVSWPANLIYKTVGSGHFPSSDCRRYTQGLIAKHGYRGPSPSPIDVLDTKGNKVGGLGMYQRGGEYAWRAYSCVGGTVARSGGSVARLAQQNTGSKNVYFDFGSTCYGPVPADRCIGSSQC